MQSNNTDKYKAEHVNHLIESEIQLITEIVRGDSQTLLELEAHLFRENWINMLILKLIKYLSIRNERGFEADIVLKSIQNCEISFRCIKYFYDKLKFPMEWSPILTVISTE